MASYMPGAHSGYKATQMEADSRKAANFPEIEDNLLKQFASEDMGLIDKVTS